MLAHTLYGLTLCVRAELKLVSACPCSWQELDMLRSNKLNSQHQLWHTTHSLRLLDQTTHEILLGNLVQCELRNKDNRVVHMDVKSPANKKDNRIQNQMGTEPPSKYACLTVKGIQLLHFRMGNVQCRKKNIQGTQSCTASWAHTLIERKLNWDSFTMTTLAWCVCVCVCWNPLVCDHQKNMVTPTDSVFWRL